MRQKKKDTANNKINSHRQGHLEWQNTYKRESQVRKNKTPAIQLSWCMASDDIYLPIYLS